MKGLGCTCDCPNQNRRANCRGRDQSPGCPQAARCLHGWSGSEQSACQSSLPSVWTIPVPAHSSLAPLKIFFFPDSFHESKTTRCAESKRNLGTAHKGWQTEIPAAVSMAMFALVMVISVCVYLHMKSVEEAHMVLHENDRDLLPQLCCHHCINWELQSPLLWLVTAMDRNWPTYFTNKHSQLQVMSKANATYGL